MAKKKTTKKRMSNYQRKTRRISRWRTFKRKMRQSFRTGYYLTCVVLVVGSISAAWWWVQSGKLSVMVEGANQAVLQQTADAGLSLQYIYLEGREHANREDITLSLGLEAGDPILGVSVRDIQKRLRKLGWVKDAVVERQLPDTLHVHIIERQPVAVWQHNEVLRLVDAEGEVIHEANANDPEFRPLLLIVGEDAPEHSVTLMQMLTAEPEIFPLVSAAVRVGNRRWDIHMHSGVEVRLPANNPERAWAMLAEMERQEQVLARDIRAVDLRVEDRIFIDVPPEAQTLVGTAGSQET